MCSITGPFYRESDESRLWLRVTFRFCDSLELTEISKAVNYVMVYYSERIQIKINSGKRHVEQSPGETRCELPAVSPTRVAGTAST